MSIEQYRKRFFNLMESTIGDAKPLINEQDVTTPKPGDPVTVDKLPQEFQNFVKTYGLTGTFSYSRYNEKLGYEFTYIKGNQSIGFNSDEIKIYEQHKGNYQKCIERGKKYSDILQNLMSGATTTEIDPRMKNYCKQKPQDPRCQGVGERMDEDSAIKKADEQINSLYPNMQYCGVVNKMQGVVTKMK